MENKITGIMVYYYFVCKRKLWYFCHNISFEKENEDVILGKLLDETSYVKNKKNINIDNTISIDFIDNNVLHEIKKSKSVEIASIWQVKYYLYYLKNKGLEEITAVINYPNLKEKISVELTLEDEEVLSKVIDEIIFIQKLNKPPYIENKNICKKCAYYDFCYI